MNLIEIIWTVRRKCEKSCHVANMQGRDSNLGIPEHGKLTL